MAATYLKKIGTGPCLLLCSTSLSYDNTPELSKNCCCSCWTFGKEMPHSCLLWESGITAVLGRSCIMHFMMPQMFSIGERSGLQAEHCSTQILLLNILYMFCVLFWIKYCFMCFVKSLHVVFI